MKKELTIALNDLTPELRYCDYKELYNFINGKKTVDKLYNIVTGFAWGEFDNNEAAEYLQEYFESLVDGLRYGSLSEEYDESDKGSPYIVGYTIGKYTFITGYTGVADRFWNTICYGY